MCVCVCVLSVEETWITMSKYEAKYNDEISFEKGVLVEVFEKGIDGWWKTRYICMCGHVCVKKKRSLVSNTSSPYFLLFHHSCHG